MKRYLLIIPAAAAAFFAARGVLDGLPHLGAVLDAVAGLIATAYCAVIARRFGSGDVLRTAWAANGASFFAIVVLTFLPWVEPALAPTVALATRTVLTGAATVLGVVSIWSFARAYLVAGLEMPGTPRQRAAAVAIGTLFAAIFAGAPLVAAARRLADGDLESLAMVVSAAGDLAIAILLVPMLLAALALRGGLLVWPWSFILASNAMYLCYDAQVGLYPTAWVDVWVIASAALTVAAALAQRAILAGAAEAA
jgi:hypothetical protein